MMMKTGMAEAVTEVPAVVIMMMKIMIMTWPVEEAEVMVLQVVVHAEDLAL